jgi:hypothetical protein
MKKHPLFAFCTVLLAAAILLTSCEEDSQPVDPTPSQIDSISYESLNDTIAIRAWMETYTGSTIQPVMFFQGPYTNHSIELEVDSMVAGTVTVAYLNGTTVVWQHTITTAESSWKAEGETASAFNAIRLQATDATGVVRLRTEPR